MAQINKPNTHFNTVLYTGTGSGGSNRQITGVGFQPDFTWVKTRGSAQEHVLSDSVRGATKALDSQADTAEETTNTRIGAFISDGFQLGSGAVQNRVNQSGIGMASWNWKAGGTAVSNTDGDITSSVSANTTNGFSIVKYTGNGSAGATIGHGLGSTPSAIFVKGLSTLSNWSSYHSVLGNTGYMRLDGTGAFATASTYWNNTSPTSSVFTAGTTGNINANGNDFVAYCFAEKKGFSKFDSYTGNGNADGTFIYTGFKPAWLMIKRTDTVNSWIIQDNKRDPFNVVTLNLNANAYGGNNNNQGFLDFTSNGFKLRKVDTGTNTAGGTYIYMAFAENPLVGTNGIPATAR